MSQKDARFYGMVDLQFFILKIQSWFATSLNYVTCSVTYLEGQENANLISWP